MKLEDELEAALAEERDEELDEEDALAVAVARRRFQPA